MKIPKGNTIKRIILYSVFGMLVFVFCAFLFFIYYTPDPFEVTCSGTSSEMGQQYGEQLGIPMKLLIKIHLEMGVCRNDATTIKHRYAAAATLFETLSQGYKEEFRAAAKSSACDLNALTYGNCFLDIGHARAGCRSVVIQTDDVFLHGHNLDWDNLGGLARWTTSIIRRNPSDGRFKTVTIAFPGMLGSLDVINERGIALSFNQLGFGRSIPKEPVFLTMRRIAETCHTYDDVRKEIFNCPSGMPFLITVSSAEEGVAAIFERVSGVTEERPLQDGWVAGCNMAQGQEVGRTSLDKVLMETQVVNLDGLKQVLGHPKVAMESNLYSVIFDYGNNRFFLASGKLPASKGGFEEFPLF